jgi:CubicO group peptidase (beta-lactamase class C family)
MNRLVISIKASKSFPSLIFTVLAIVACSWVQAQQKLQIDSEAIDRYLKSEMDKWKVPGCAVAILNGKDVLFANGYGLRNVEEGLPVSPNTVFKIASCTKSFTAAAAGLLVGQKKLDWDRPVIEYLPQLKLADKELTSQVTLRDLLSHRTGIYDDDWSWVGDHIDEKRMYEILAAMPRQNPLRTGYLYSNMTYALAGRLIALKSNDSWRNVIRMNFLEPLSMESTVFSHNESSGLDDFAFGYEYADSSNTFVRGDLSEHYTDSLSVCEAFAFISSSALDLSKWLRLFINGGYRQEEQIIPKDVFQELIRPVNYMHPSTDSALTESYYCMGWIQNYYKGHQLLQHSGGLTGFKCYMSFMPKDSIGIVVLTNGQSYFFPTAVTYDLYDVILGLPPSDWSNKFMARQKRSATKKNEAGVDIPGTRPSKLLHEYVGLYHSQWLGDMKVTLENETLYFEFHHYPKEKMKHAHYDTFFTEPQRRPGTGITFQLNHDGKVAAMLLNEFLFEKVE